ncbi:sorbosone dehydrogenase family protein [Arthrobacter sp. B1805]|uniref:PQQ-dependent sugar dehydrogenase n=1 Tax=Arthrobacter sp. B1805 TaxID=2058892 RepID=UPI000CE3D609|nr:PQQ-dependent sugar dehydrogenase [Arthrobacter sp. B1805]
MPRHLTLAGLAGLVVVTLATGCTTSTAGPSGNTNGNSGPDVGVNAAADAQDITTGLALPWSMAFLGDTLLISERDTARIVELDSAGNRREVGTVEGVRHGGEGGLLGLAVDDQDRLYAYSTGTDGNRIQRLTLDGSPGSLALGDAETLVDDLPSSSNHNGGRIAFGPDGMLYAGVGDAGEPESAQDLDSLAGKILRMTPDGEVPADNPYPGSLVFSHGHRNVQGLAWAADGTMFASEFGQNTWDELNITEAGENYGWPVVEGIADEDGFVDPVQQWSPADASPSGITVADNTVFIANLRGERLRAVPVSDPTTSTEYLVGEYGRLRAVMEAPDGRLWVLTNNTSGRGNPQPGDDRIVSIDLPG